MFKIIPEFKELMPDLTLEEYSRLEESIKSEGCREPIIVWDDIIVDGHNRYEICQKYNIPFKVLKKDFQSEEDAKEWIILNQLGRRNSSVYDKSILAINLEDVFKEQKPVGKTRDKIAKLVGVSGKIIDKVKRIEECAAPEIKEKLRQGELTINKAHNYIKRKEIRAEKLKVEPPKGKYRIIYADPPWSYGDKRDGKTTGAEDHYPCMSIDELCAMPIRDLTEKDAVLFLWGTSPLLEDAFKVVSAWGFKYKTSFVWDKVKHNMGHYNSVRHEFLLICTKGSCLPDVTKLHDSVVTIERTKHSSKPEVFRDIIDEIYPHGNRIELFARESAKEGWDVWGNEPMLLNQETI